MFETSGPPSGPNPGDAISYLSDSSFALVAVSLLLVFGVAFLSWRMAVGVVLYILVVEGALRKWAFPEWANVIYWIKDVVLTAAYARFFLGKILQRLPAVPALPVNLPLGLLLLYGLGQMFNPLLPNLRVGALGFKSYFFYVPLFYMLLEAVPTKEALLRFLVPYALFSIPVSLLGLVQHYTPPSGELVGYLKWYGDSTMERVSLVGEYVRVASTFSFISGYVAYLFFVVLLLLALLSARRHRRTLLTPLLLLALLLAVANAFMTGSRWLVLVLLVMVPVFILMAGGSARSRPAFFLRIAALSTLLLLATGSLFGNAVRAFIYRMQTSYDIEERLLDHLSRQFRDVYLSPWGYGIGSSHQAARFLVAGGDSYSWLPTRDWENEPERVMLELGPVGFSLFYLVKAVLLLCCFRLPRQLRDPELKVLGVITFLAQPSLFFWPTVFNVTADIYFWTLSGFLLLLPRLDRDTATASVPGGPRAGARQCS